MTARREGAGLSRAPSRPPWRRLIGPGIFTLLMLAILLGLGTWQVRRLAWKEALLARIDSAEAAPPIPIPAHPTPFEKVEITGQLENGRAALFGAEVRETASGPAMGAHLIVPLLRPAGPPLLVDRGWVPLDRSRPVPQPQGEVTLTGYLRPGEPPGWFTPAPDVTGRHFYALDPDAIGAALGLQQVAPDVLIAMGPAGPDAIPAPAQALPRPPNNHLSYAITWYGLAVALLAVYLLWARKLVRGESESPG